MVTISVTNVLLVAMPFLNIDVPALGISLLQASLKRQGVSCDIRYFHFPFAAQIGQEFYNRVANTSTLTLLGEWLFASCLFDVGLPEAQDYVDNILKQPKFSGGRIIPQAVISQIVQARTLTSSYLESCLRSVLWERYDIIGFTNNFSQNLASLALARRIKDIWPDKIIVFGGANCEGEMGVELHRQFPFIDYICSGESDYLFPELVFRLQAASIVDDLQGLIHRKDGQTVANGSNAELIYDLNALPFPDFDDYLTQLNESALALTPADVHLLLETSRGCWWGVKSQCTFCGLNPETLAHRSKSGERSLQEFTYLAQRYPALKNVDVVDRALNMRFFQDVIPGLIERNLGLSIMFEVKANLRKEQIRQLQLAGVSMIQPGIESLDSNILHLMHKGCTAVQNLQTLKWSREFGIDADWSIIAGFPGEDPAAYSRMAEMIPELAHIQPPIGRSTARMRLDRNSPYFRNPQAYGIIDIHPATAYRYIYPFQEEILARLAYFFDFDCANRQNMDRYTYPLDRAIEQWHEQFGSASLLLMPGKERLILFDTRPIANQREVVLEGIAKVIYEFCEAGQTLSSIIRYLQDLGESNTTPIDTSQIESILASMIERHLILYVDNRYLSLAIPIGDRAQQFIDCFAASLQTG